MATPTLSRGNADRSEDLREPGRLHEKWSQRKAVDHGRRWPGAVGRRPASGCSSWRRARWRRAPPPGRCCWAPSTGSTTGRCPARSTEGGGLRELGSLLSDTDAGLLVTATALLTWHAAAGFCPRCGLPSAPTPAGWSRICPNGHEDFPRTDPAVIVLVHDGADSIVLARQPIWPKGRVSVLAGFVEAGESLEGTVAREILEEIGVHVTDVSYLGSQPWPFPRSLMVGFAARAEPGAELRPRDGEIEEAHWYDRAAVRADDRRRGPGRRRQLGLAPRRSSAGVTVRPSTSCCPARCRSPAG